MESCGRVAVLLATYNGERYLDEQIRSLHTQTYSDFVVIARDDHSSDRTPENPRSMVNIPSKQNQRNVRRPW